MFLLAATGWPVCFLMLLLMALLVWGCGLLLMISLLREFCSLIALWYHSFTVLFFVMRNISKKKKKNNMTVAGFVIMYNVRLVFMEIMSLTEYEQQNFNFRWYWNGTDQLPPASFLISSAFFNVIIFTSIHLTYLLKGMILPVMFFKYVVHAIQDWIQFIVVR